MDDNINLIVAKILNDSSYSWYKFCYEYHSAIASSYDSDLVFETQCSKIYEKLKSYADKTNFNAIKFILDMYKDDYIKLSYEQITKYCSLENVTGGQLFNTIPKCKLPGLLFPVLTEFKEPNKGGKGDEMDKSAK